MNKKKVQRKGQSKLLPNRHPQKDFFIAEIFDGTAIKGDIASMEHPMFTLSTKKDLRVIDYRSIDGNVKIFITPNVSYGLPTIFDKDILLYCGSVIMEHLNQGKEPSRTMRFSSHDLLVATNRDTGGKGYEALKNAFRRLKGVNIETNIKTNGKVQTVGFGFIESYEFIESNKVEGRVIGVQVTISEWLYNSLVAGEVLTINKDYFRLRKPLERRLYEIARKHCGKQKSWNISLCKLKQKTGSTSSDSKFKFIVKDIVKSNHMPDYAILFDDSKDMVTFMRKEMLTNNKSHDEEVDVEQPKVSDTTLSPKTLEKGLAIVKEAETGWDYDVIQQEFFDWSKKREKPNNLEAAFLGFVRRKVKNAPGSAKIKSADTVKQEQKSTAEEEKHAEESKRKEIEDFLKNKNDDYRGLVEILLRYYPVSYCRNMLLTRRDEPIQIRKHDAHVSCEINGLYIGGNLHPILKDLEKFFDCAVDLTIDDSREMSESLIYTGSFEELEEEMNSANIFATKQDDIA
jgi:hypothetical protein